MPRAEWCEQMIAVIGEPTTPAQKEQRKIDEAIEKIKCSFGAGHTKAARTCIDVLQALLIIARRHPGELSRGISGYDQKQIGSVAGWSNSVVGRYTIQMEKLGLLRITRKAGKCNQYFFVFV